MDKARAESTLLCLSVEQKMGRRGAIQAIN